MLRTLLTRARPVLASALAALFCFQALGFQAPAAFADAPARADAGAQARVATPALWVVRDEDTTIHIFGTAHLLPKGVQWLHGPVRRAFEQADTLVLEMVQPDDPAQLRPLVARLGLNPQGVSLSSQLPGPLRQEMAQAAAQVGLPVAALEPLKPWLAATTIAVAGLQSLGLSPDQGVEQVLTAHAKATGKAIDGLETPEQQFGFLASLPEADQMALLRSAIRDLHGLHAEANSLMQGWATGDIEAVGDLMNRSLQDSPNLSRVLLTERNARWAAWVARRMDQPGHAFLAVGAGHLAGENSLIAMLNRHGFKVQRLPVPAADTDTDTNTGHQ